MRRYHWVRLYALLLMIILFLLSVLAVSGSSFSIFRESATQRSIVHSVQDIDRASAVIMKEVTQIARSAGQEQYESLLELVRAEDDTSLSEKELDDYFRMGYANRIRDKLGDNASTICENLAKILENGAPGNVRVIYDPDTVIDEDSDESGVTTGLRIRNVTFECDGRASGIRRDTLSYRIRFPDVVFHAGNDDLFRYVLVAQKGIYITGQTSSIIGDIYAGKHSDQERRDAEIVYGETGTYGGINILTTQLGVKADRIVCQGDINVNGSFVIFSPLAETLECYAQRMNEIRGFSKETVYTLDGEFIPTYKMDEALLTEYNDTISLVDRSLDRLDTISIYYDSNNDGIYVGKYRKLISGTDIEIANDFTGIVATPGNVIIHNDVNFEGTILCGDRIYIMGNNNIVSNPGIIRSIMASDFNDENNIKVSNYISGLKGAGYTEPEYYVVPYR
ncbi:MAG: hypothetical protein K6G67_05665 [Lachnospiraceae bacterium]|nr:hypothetical protein [Lachnospiraceae bacterium]